MEYMAESGVKPFAISDPDSEADALAAEILTMTCPAHAKAIARYWRLVPYGFPAPTTMGEDTRYTTGAEVRAIFEREVLRRILSGNPPIAPSVRINPSPTSELMYPRGATTRPLFSRAIEMVQAPGRLVTSSDEEWAQSALACAAAAASSLVAASDDADEQEGRVREMASGGDEALAHLAEIAAVLQER